MGHSTHLRYWNAWSKPRVDQTFLLRLSFNVEGYECKKMNANNTKLNVMLKIVWKRDGPSSVYSDFPELYVVKLNFIFN